MSSHDVLVISWMTLSFLKFFRSLLVIIFGLYFCFFKAYEKYTRLLSETLGTSTTPVFLHIIWWSCQYKINYKRRCFSSYSGRTIHNLVQRKRIQNIEISKTHIKCSIIILSNEKVLKEKRTRKTFNFLYIKKNKCAWRKSKKPLQVS